MDALLKPPRLKPGSTIGVAAVSGPVDEARLDQGLARLRGKGYRVVESSNLRARRGFFAGSDEERAAGYQALLANPEVEAIFFARGGYGASRVLRLVDPSAASHLKIHLGCSDLTALFAFLRQHAGWTTFYGPMVAAGIGEEETLDWERVLCGAVPEPHRFAAPDVIAPGHGEGELVGGCLSLLASLCGTPEAVDARGSILFWEDVGEQTYRLDRLLTQLERSGTLTDVRGMVIGSVDFGGQEGSFERTQEYLRDRFRGSPFPVAIHFPAGHLPRPRTLPLGARVALDLEDAPILSFLEAGTV